MTIINRLIVNTLLFAAMGFSTTASAALIDRGGGLIYDNDLNITWLADANYAATQYANTGGAQGDSDGNMSWANANTWVSNLSYYDSVRDQNLGGWRLPTSDSACTGTGSNYNCTGGELGHLFYNELGGTAGSSLHDSTDPDLALFTNIGTDYYWLSGSYDPNPEDRAWVLYIDSGSQENENKLYSNSVWAVRSGDVGAVVPVPAAVWLFGSGLLGLLGIARKKKS